MKVFQTLCEITMRINYNQFTMKEGQIVVAAPGEMTKFFTEHPHMRVITDEKLLAMAPPLHLIKQPTNPHTMSKDDILAELRSYGIAADPYDFSSKLSMQLDLARKMKRRNFVTVMVNGKPTFIDSANIPMPQLSHEDNDLKEPQEPEGEFYEVDDELPQHQNPEEFKAFDVSDVAMAMDPIVDEEIQKNRGKIEFEDWVETFREKHPVDKEVDAQSLLFKEQQPSVEEIERAEALREKGMTNDEITPEAFRYLIEPKTGHFCDEPTTLEKENFRTINWAKMSLDVGEKVLDHYGIKYEYDQSDTKKRWIICEKLKVLYDEVVEKDKLLIELNMLNKRVQEIEAIEPDYRKFSTKSLKRRITELGRFGVDVWYGKDMECDMRNFARKLFTITKTGFDIPDSEEEIDKLLIRRRRSKGLIKPKPVKEE